MTEELPAISDPPIKRSWFGRARHHAALIGAVAISVGVLLKGAIDGFHGYVAAYHAAMAMISGDFAALYTSPEAIKPLSVAVAPFKTFDAKDQPLAEQIRRSLTTDLNRIVGITSRLASLDTSPVTFRFIIDGDLQAADNVVLCNIQILEATSGSQLWADRFSINATNPIEARELSAARIANVLNYQLVKIEAEKLTRKPKTKWTPDDYALLGRAALHKLRTRESLKEAEEYFARALASQPDKLEALVGMSMTLGFRAAGFPDERTIETGEAAMKFADRAIAVAPASADAHLARSQASFSLKKLDEARIEAERAIALNPNLSQAYVNLASTLFRAGEFQAAVNAGKHAYQINPADPGIALAPLHIGNAFVGLARYTDAIWWLEIMRANNPSYWRTHAALATAYGLSGRSRDAQAAVSSALQYNPKLTVAYYRDYLQSDAPAFQEFLDRVSTALKDIGLSEK